MDYLVINEGATYRAGVTVWEGPAGGNVRDISTAELSIRNRQGNLPAPTIVKTDPGKFDLKWVGTDGSTIGKVHSFEIRVFYSADDIQIIGPIQVEVK
jgi:hypothetical protein